MHSALQLNTLKEKYYWKLEPFNIGGNRYTVKLATDESEIQEALKLRFQVFNLELGEGLSSSYLNQKDEDQYDAQCDHLLVVDNQTGQVIGTYRMQDNEMASSGHGFYTSNEFQIRSFPDEVLLNAVELGRACIHKNHRNGRVLYLLWRGLAKYMEKSGKRFLFGCCSLTSQNCEEGYRVYDYLQRKGNLHENLNIDVQKEYSCSREAHHDEEEPDIPQLFRLYLELGTKVCSEPAIDRHFKTIDFLILLDIDRLSEQSKTLFFR